MRSAAVPPAGPATAEERTVSEIQETGTETSTRETRTRGAWLTVMLVFFTLAQVLVLGLLYLSWRDLVDRGQPGQGITLTAMVATTAALVALVGVWRWKRWGAYLFGLIVLAGLVIDLLSGVSPVALLARVALVVLLAWAIRQRWEWFS
jgi:hypothetical protein